MEATVNCCARTVANPGQICYNRPEWPAVWSQEGKPGHETDRLHKTPIGRRMRRLLWRMSELCHQHLLWLWLSAGWDLPGRMCSLSVLRPGPWSGALRHLPRLSLPDLLELCCPAAGGPSLPVVDAALPDRYERLAGRTGSHNAQAIRLTVQDCPGVCPASLPCLTRLQALVPLGSWFPDQAPPERPPPPSRTGGPGSAPRRCPGGWACVRNPGRLSAG
jgi:hypothetical protein